MPQTLNEVLKKYVEDVHEIYGEKLRTVILYGSYARGGDCPKTKMNVHRN